MNNNTANLKQKIMHEMFLYFLYATFFALFFISLTTYQRLTLGDYAISYPHYAYDLVQAMILAKIILLGESFGLGNQLASKPLIVTTLYKAVLFSLLVLVLTLLEHFVMGYLHGIAASKVYEELLSKGIDQVIAKVFVVFYVFILFFAFLETARFLGEGEFMKLFFYRKSKSETGS